jgi:Protein of unknown function (DUF664)
VPFRGGRTVSARWVLPHVIEETARHAGHLDVVRELLDGTTGDWGWCPEGLGTRLAGATVTAPGAIAASTMLSIFVPIYRQ